MRLVIAIDDASIIVSTEQQQKDIQADFLEQCGDIFDFKTHDPQQLQTIPNAEIYVIDFGGLGIGLNTGRAERCANLLLSRIDKKPGSLFCIWSSHTMSWYRGAMADHLGNENEDNPLPDNVVFYDKIDEHKEFWDKIRAWCGLETKPEPDAELEQRIFDLRYAVPIESDVAAEEEPPDPDEWLDRYQAEQRRKYLSESQEEEDADAELVAAYTEETADDDEEEEPPKPELTEEERAAKKAALIAKLSAPIPVEADTFEATHKRRERGKPKDGGPGWGDVIGEIRIPVRIGTRPNMGSGFAYFKFVDCIADVTDDDGDEIGRIGGVMGGIYEISFPTGTGDLFQYMLRPEDIWPAIVTIHNKFREEHKELFAKPEADPETTA